MGDQVGDGDEMPDDTVLSELVGPVDEVLPHQILREGKVPQDHIFDDLEAGRFLHRPSDGTPDPADVDTALVPRQLFVEALDFDREILGIYLKITIRSRRSPKHDGNLLISIESNFCLISGMS